MLWYGTTPFRVLLHEAKPAASKANRIIFSVIVFMSPSFYQRTTLCASKGYQEYWQTLPAKSPAQREKQTRAGVAIAPAPRKAFAGRRTIHAPFCGIMRFRSCLKFLTILKRLDFQGAGSGFRLPIGGYSGSWLSDARRWLGLGEIKASFDSPLDFRYRLPFSRQIAQLSSFEKRRAIP